jgi:hypothetical protein
MGVTVRFDVASTHLLAGRLLAGCPDASAELERVVPTHGPRIPLVWIRSSDQPTVRRQFAAHDCVTAVETCAEDGDWALYRLSVVDPEPGIFDCIRAVDGMVSHAAGDDRWWQVIVYCRREGDVSALQAACDERDIEIQPQSIKHDHIALGREQALTREQHEALAVAFEGGYFDVPRQTTLQEIAETVGISDQAVSARIRRGVGTLLTGQFTARQRPSTPDTGRERPSTPGAGAVE